MFCFGLVRIPLWFLIPLYSISIFVYVRYSLGENFKIVYGNLSNLLRQVTVNPIYLSVLYAVSYHIYTYYN